MAEVDPREFDPYYKWLAIPPQEQPPNCYRLLGITLFEGDPDVIAAAADRQMAHIKSFGAGKYASQSQQLLNELAKARVCLLNAEQKSRYDVRLRDEIDADALDESFDTFFSQELETAPATAVIRNAAPSSLPIAPPSVVVVRARPKHRRPSPWIPLILLLCSLCAVFAVFQLFRPGSRSELSSTPKAHHKPKSNPVVPKEIGAPPPSNRREGEPPRIPLPALKLNSGLQTRVSPPPVRPEPSRRQDSQLLLPRPTREAELVIDVDLSKPRQRVAVSHDSFQILRFKIADKNTDVSQPLSASLSARVNLDPLTNVTLQLEVERGPNGAFLFVTPLFAAADEEFPFTLPSLGRLKRKLGRDYQRAAKTIAALNIELQNLDTFISAPIVKSLAERGQARTRKLQIEKQLPVLRQQLAQMETSLQGIARLLELAELVDADCVVELAKGD